MKSNYRYGPSKLQMMTYMMPGTLLYTLIVFIPVLMALYYSLFNWSGVQNQTFIGLDNYVELIQDGVFWKAFSNNLFILLFSLFGQIGLGFFFATLLNRQFIRLKNLHRTLIYFPATLSAVVIGFVWSLIYDYHFGLLNWLLRSIGLDEFIQAWLSSKDGIMMVVTVPLIWQWSGYMMIILLSALSSIEPDIFSMAEIDGARGIRLAISITLPLIKGSIMVCVTICISGCMRIFDHIYVMTYGGPGTSSMVVAMYAYITSFLKSRLGYGMSISIGILILSLLVIFVFRIVLRLIIRDGGDDK